MRVSSEAAARASYTAWQQKELSTGAGALHAVAKAAQEPPDQPALDPDGQMSTLLLDLLHREVERPLGAVADAVEVEVVEDLLPSAAREGVPPGALLLAARAIVAPVVTAAVVVAVAAPGSVRGLWRRPQRKR